MSTETVSLELLTKQTRLDMEELRAIRKDVLGMMQLVNANYDLTRRIERRAGELRDDIEVMVKMELGGSLANIQTSIENSLARIEEAMGTVMQRVEKLEGKF